MPQLSAPEQHRRLELPSPPLHGGNVLVQSRKPERPSHHVPPEGKRYAVARGATKRGAIHPGPERRERFDGIEEAFSKGAGPEPDRGRHGSPAMGVAGPENCAITVGE